AARFVLPVFGHTERERGAEWWGKSLLVTFGLLSKVTRRKGETNTRHHPKNGYAPQHSPKPTPVCQANYLPT
ncbi:MAG: hypothetical protein WBR57_26875, partial [Pseudomonas sp.]